MSLFPSQRAEDFGFEEVTYKKDGRIAYITINRPFNYNAYSTPALQDLDKKVKASQN